MVRYQRLPYFDNPQGNRKRGRPRNSWRRSVIKEVGRSWNELRFLAVDREVERTHRQPMFLEGTMDSIIIFPHSYVSNGLKTNYVQLETNLL
jgi:hypothetical protein